MKVAFVKLPRNLRSTNGLTLVELMIAITISFVSILGIYRMFSASLRSYNLQTQLTQMHQDATFSIHKISEALMQVGSALPQKNYQIIYGDADSVCLLANSTGSSYTFSSNLLSSNIIVMTDASAFKNQTFILKDSLDSSVTKFTISKVDTNAVQDTIFLTTSGTFYSGTTIYGANTFYYYKSGTNIMFKQDTGSASVLAENIDSLSFTYYTSSHAATTNWTQFYSVNIYLRARTALPDPKYKYPGINDGYRRVPMSIEVRFRNKI